MSGFRLGCWGFYGNITISKFGRSSSVVVELQFPAEIGEVIAKRRGMGCNASIADIVGGGSKGIRIILIILGG